MKEIIKEWGGARGFPGVGQRLFSGDLVLYIADALHHIEDEGVKKYLTDWFVTVFSKDRQKFNTKTFLQAVDTSFKRTKTEPPRFQARHYYYLAKFVSNIEDLNAREFVCNWLADIIGSKINPKFNKERWKEWCGLEVTPMEKKLAGIVKRRYESGKGYVWPKWYQDHLDATGQTHDPDTGIKGLKRVPRVTARDEEDNLY